MTPYDKLCVAIEKHGGVATTWEVRHELKAYFQQFKVLAKNPLNHKVIDWNDLYTPEEYNALINAPKSKKRCKECKCKPCQCHKLAENSVGQVHLWRESVVNKAHEDFGKAIDEYRKRQREEYDGEKYNGDF